MIENLTVPINTHRCGFVGIVGRPNVGKSTLLNRILGKKISITSRKSQTTRQRILGIKNTEHIQTIYVDTPGFHLHDGTLLNQYMTQQLKQALSEIDLILFVITTTGWTKVDAELYQAIKQTDLPIFLVINKIDKISDKTQLLPYIEHIKQFVTAEEIIPLTALSGKHIPVLETCIARYLPERKPLYPKEQSTNVNESFLAAEIIREKITRSLGEEIPYITGVTIENFEKEEKIWRIHGLIFVERGGQKAIIIGKEGERLKRIAEQARKDMEILFNNKVFLKLWIKVSKNWTQKTGMLKKLGYEQHNS